MPLVSSDGWNLFPVADLGRATKYFFLCLCGHCVFALFTGSTTVLGSHQCSTPQGVDHLSSAGDVCFIHEGVLVGTSREVLCGLAPYPELAIG